MRFDAKGTKQPTVCNRRGYPTTIPPFFTTFSLSFRSIAKGKRDQALLFPLDAIFIRTHTHTLSLSPFLFSHVPPRHASLLFFFYFLPIVYTFCRFMAYRKNIETTNAQIFSSKILKYPYDDGDDGDDDDDDDGDGDDQDDDVRDRQRPRLR